MDISSIKQDLPDYAKDIKLNLGSVTTDTSSGLDTDQLAMLTVASALASRNPAFSRRVIEAARATLSEDQLQAAQSANAIMAMNNIYYRFTHLAGDDTYQTMPARLRMQVIGSPGIDKTTFELLCLAVSAINGCGMCMASHEKVLRKQDVSREAIQAAVKVASVVHAAAVTVENS